MSAEGKPEAAKAAPSTKKVTRTTKKAASPEKKAAAKSPARRPRLKDPEGGLTAAGRKAFAEKDGSHLRPGVKGPADTPEKMKRKGSFLTRHFTHPRGPMIKEGEPTRLALSAHAWGEPVPKTESQAHKLAAKGRKLLEQYHKAKDAAAPGTRTSAKKRSAKAEPAPREAP